MIVIKVLLTVAVLYLWLILMMANLTAAGRSAGQMQQGEEIPESLAQHRTTLLVLIWSIFLTALGGLAGWLIWTKL